MTGVDRAVLAGALLIVVGLPFGAGSAVPLAGVLVLALLATTLRQRARRGGPRPRGLLPLVAFATLALLATVPLPPQLLRVLAPETARLSTAMLPGWPAGGWTAWRPVALDPWRAWFEIAGIAVAFGVFALLVAYPWRAGDADEDPRPRLVESAAAGLLGGGVLLAALAFVAQAAGARSTTMAALGLRPRLGPFAAGDDLAAWLGAVLPVGMAYVIVVGARTMHRIVPGGIAGALHRGRLPVAMLIRGQRRLYLPILATAALAVVLVAHTTTGSRLGVVALAVGIAAMLASVSAGRIVRGAAALLLLLALGALLVWAAAGARPGGEPGALPSRIAVAQQSLGAVPSVAALGAGLGSWPAVYRLRQAEPVNAVAWSHAQNEWVELLVETGVPGLLLVVAFAWSMRRGARASVVDGPVRLLRAGLTGGIVVLLVHSFLGSALRTPANLALLMGLLGLLALTADRPPSGRAAALGVLAAVLAVALVPSAADQLRMALGRTARSPDLRLLEAARSHGPTALALVRGAVDRAPTDPAAQAALAGRAAGPDGDAALARAVQLAPWDPDLRDRLALRLAAHDGPAGAAQLEESLARTPALASHRVLVSDASPDVDAAAAAVTALEPALEDAVVRGLERASDAALPARRGAIVSELVAVHEARGDWAAAAETLRAAAARDPDVRVDLGRAARDLLRVGRTADAEATLLEAVRRAPQQGGLYRTLAVDVYAARGDFDRAERMLESGERNARDMEPVYDGVAELLARRESTWRATTAER